MAVHCPYCQHAIGLKGPKPGRYSTKCPKCLKKFLLTVPQDAEEAPVASALRTEREADPVASPRTEPAPAAPETVVTTSPVDPHATVDWSVSPAPGLPPTLADPGPTGSLTPDPGATAEWGPTTEVPASRPTAPAGSPEATAAQGFTMATGASRPVLLPEGGSGGPLPGTLGGYQVIKELGRGGMGAVYLARQLSLDRNVALKVMRPEWASNPSFVSRFTREAYAAAQLVHHNVVQIYDFGQEQGTNYFSMEFVQGQTLSDLVRSEKKLDPEVAVGYILQAARGLKYAHDQSMIHRDIKPDNLLLNDQGVVKVADLGLVKTPAVAEVELARERETGTVMHPGTFVLATSGSQITLANVAMGTPAFMAPEQAKDAASVDGRADIYSLGCTLYDLVTGRPPFEGKTAVELITKHQSEPIVPPEMIVKRVPRALSEIILKMVAKRPEDRFANLGEVIQALEEFLGVSSTGPFSPREEHANLLTECVERFNASPTARLRPKVFLAAAGLCGLVVLGAAMARQPLLAGGFLGLGLMTAVAYFITTGITSKTHLFLKVRELVFGSSLGDWAMVAAGLVLFFGVLVVTHLLWVWIAFGIVAVLIAVGWHVALDRKVEAERAETIARAEAMLKSMRLHGLDEEMLRQFVSKYSGERWEEFYEALFGYEAKLSARDRWGRGERGRLRQTYGAWRDPIVRWIEAKERARREVREKRLLKRIEEKGLEAQGVNLVTARRRAQRAAEAMVTMASEIKDAAKVPAALRTQSRAIGAVLREAAAKPEDVLVDRETGLSQTARGSVLAVLLGPKLRFLAGAALLAAFLLWMHQNNLLSQRKLAEIKESAQAIGSQITKAATQAVKTQDLSAVKKSLPMDVDMHEEGSRPLQFPMLPARIAALLFNAWNPGVAGLILIVSSFFRGARMSLFAVPAAVIAFAGPALGGSSLGAWASVVLGVVVLAAGLVLGRSRA